MTAADEFPLPPGDPGALKAAGGTLQDVSTDLSAMDTRIGREQAGMAAVLAGDAGAAAGTETSSLATITGDKGGRVGDGASAFTDYGTALETAVAEVTAIRRQADQAEIDARSEAARIRPGPPYDARQAIYHSIRVAGADPAADALPLGDRDARPGRRHGRRPAHRRGAGIPLGHDAGPDSRSPSGMRWRRGCRACSSWTGRTGPGSWRPSCSRCWSRASRSRPRCWPSWRRTRTTPGSPRRCWRRSARRRRTGRCW